MACASSKHFLKCNSESWEPRLFCHYLTHQWPMMILMSLYMIWRKCHGSIEPTCSEHDVNHQTTVLSWHNTRSAKGHWILSGSFSNVYVAIPNNPQGIKVGRCVRTCGFSFLIIGTYYPHPLPLWTNWWLHLLVIAATGETAAARKFVGCSWRRVCGGNRICGTFLNGNWENSADCSTNVALAPCPAAVFCVGEGILGWRCAGESSFTNLLSFEIPAASRPRSHPIFISNQNLTYHPQCWHTIYTIFLRPCMNMCVCSFNSIIQIALPVMSPMWKSKIVSRDNCLCEIVYKNSFPKSSIKILKLRSQGWIPPHPSISSGGMLSAETSVVGSMDRQGVDSKNGLTWIFFKKPSDPNWCMVNIISIIYR